MKTVLSIILLIFVFTSKAFSQDSTAHEGKVERNSLGLGVGIDYGGIGMNELFYLNNNFGVFIYAGYPLTSFGFGGGMKFRTATNQDAKNAVMYFSAMYGYNAAIIISNAPQYDKVFYGPTFGLGVDLPRRRKNTGYWSLGILLPIRLPEVDQYIWDLKTRHGVAFTTSFLPIGFTIGYRIVN